MFKIAIFLCVIVLVKGKKEVSWSLVGNPLLAAHPCKDNDDITISYEPGRPPEEENKYDVYIRQEVPTSSKVEIEFDSEATITLSSNTASSGRVSANSGIFTIRFFRPASSIGFTVKGSQRGSVPYFKSLKINTQEYCEIPNVGYLDQYIEGYQDTAEIQLSAPEGCGRRKVEHTELIVNGEVSKPGDWPWHVAIYKHDRNEIKYICGGTLISKTIVLTAAHCATIRGVPVTPEILGIILGKYNLFGGDIETQEREVHSVIVHEDFKLKNYLDNDIALLKLKTEVSYNDYVQPACIWNAKAYERLPPTKKIFGTIVGWGFDQTESLSSQLKQATIPKVTESTCIKKNPLFYGNVLGNEKKFCAGWANGTSACNGDSGGGFMVFIPDNAKDESANAVGSWHVRGIVSLSAARPDIALCDPEQYTVFTDIAKYTGWINNHLNK